MLPNKTEQNVRQVFQTPCSIGAVPGSNPQNVHYFIIYIAYPLAIWLILKLKKILFSNSLAMCWLDYFDMFVLFCSIRDIRKFARWLKYRVFIKSCGFSLKFCDFSKLCQFCCSAGVLPAWWVYTHWHHKQKKAKVGNIFNLRKIHNI